MTKIKTALLSTAFVLTCFSPVAAYADGENIGINSAVKGNVTVRSGTQDALQAVIKDPIFLNDEVNSNHDSSLQVLLLDQTVFTVGPDCLLTIDKFVYDPAASNNALNANVAKGMFRFMSGNISKSGTDSVSINTPVASMGVRGTMVEGLVGADAIEFARQAGVLKPDAKLDLEGASLFVLRGPGRKSTSKNRKGEITVTSGGETVTLNQSGMAVFVAHKDSPPTKIFYVSKKDFKKFNDVIRTTPAGGPSYKPFALAPFMEWDPPAARKDDIQDLPLMEDPSKAFDWPELEIISGPTPPTNCTPADPDYPNCL